MIDFVQLLVQGAVEASKKSVEQQGEFAKQLQAQAQLVNELEHIVKELENNMRADNWSKTAEKYKGENQSGQESTGVVEHESESVGKAKGVEKPIEKFKLDFYMEAECPACR